MTSAGAFIPVLGHDQVLLDAGAVSAHRVIARDRGVVQGIAAFVPLYGRGAEGVIAVRDPSRLDLIGQLVEHLLEALAREGRAVVDFLVAPGQAPVAAHITSGFDARLRGDRLSLTTRAGD